MLLVCGEKTNGIRLFRTGDYAQVSEDRDYGDTCHGADFAAVSKSGGPTLLATSSLDGFIRLYEVNPNGDLRLKAKKKAPGGSKPIGIRFSPNGSRIAIGFYETAEVAVLSAADLSLVCRPDIKGLRGWLWTVAWSADGSFLYAAGTHRPFPDKKLIIRWADGGSGARTELPALTQDTIFCLRSLRDGGIAFAAADPAIGIVNRQGERKLFFGLPESAASLDPSKFLVSSDGRLLCAVDLPIKGRSACLSLVDRTATVAPVSTNRESSARPPITKGLDVSNWAMSRSPKLNGKKLFLNKNEASLTLAIAPDMEHFLLGTTVGLRLFDRNGVQKWGVDGPAGPGAVNISGDGRFVISSFNDGTIHWYRIEDGRELFAFFADWQSGFCGDCDVKRWVLTTPSGYYDAPPGSEDIIGWHINNGSDAAADFFPVSRFRATYYRPDIIARLLETRDEAEATRLADAAIGRKAGELELAKLAPPVITLESPADGTEGKLREITVRYDVRTPSGEPVTLVRVLVDGRQADVPRGMTVETTENAFYELRVNVPDHDCELSLIAENRYAASEPATVRLKWRGEQKAVAQPKLFVLAIGISKYAGKNELQWPAKDANDFVVVMQRQKGLLYGDVQVKLLTNERATRDAILDGLEWIEKSTTQNDVAMVFLSGHGWNDPADRTYYFIPANFEEARLRRTAVPSVEIQKTIQSIKGNVVVFLDTCYSGNVLGSGAMESRGDINGLANELVSAENGAVVLTASTGRQVALERPEWGNGAFTKFLVEGLSGKADLMKIGRITIGALGVYISEKVKELTGGQQTPASATPKTIADFAVAMSR